MDTSTLKDFPNVLLAWGSDIYGSNRGEATQLLHDDSSAQSYRHGMYDFTYLWWHGKSGAASHNSWDDSLRPRPMRGRIYLPGVPTSSQSRLSPYLLLHETLHHWIDTRALRSARMSGVALPDEDAIVAKFASGELDFETPPMIGREDAHWSPYWQSDDSVLDGTAYEDTGWVGHLKRWDAIQLPRISVEVDPGVWATTTTTLSDLDLYAMGVKSARECYPDNRNRFRWIEPQFVGPTEFRMGSMVVVRRGGDPSSDLVYEFGFSREHNTVAVTRNGMNVANVRIANDFDPFTSPGSSCYFRIRHVDGELRFDLRRNDWKAKSWSATVHRFQGFGSSEPGPEFVFDPNLDSRGARSSFWGWATVHTEQVGRNIEALVGVSTNRPEKAWTELATKLPAFIRYERPNGTLTAVQELNFVAPRSPPDVRTAAFGWKSWQNWGRHQQRLFMRTNAPDWRIASDQTLRLGLPHLRSTSAGIKSVPLTETRFDPRSDADGGTKLLWRTAGPRFEFAVGCTPGHVLLSPRAGGGVANHFVLGRAHSTPVADMTFGTEIVKKQKPPPANSYRAAHIIIAASNSDITSDMVRAVDTRRRILDQAFADACEQRRSMRSDLETS